MKNFTIKAIGKAEYKSRGSKFYSYTHPIANHDDYRHLISVYRSRYPEACHVCSAYRLLVGSRLDEQGADDGEPKGSSGLPILNQLKRNELVNVATYVIRIFGGTLLGIPGLIDSYSNVALLSIDSVKHVTWRSMKSISFTYPYELKGKVESIIKKLNLEIVKQNFSESIYVEILIDKDIINLFKRNLKDLSAGQIKLS